MEHHFNIEEASKYGIECAILLYNIRFWIKKNESNGAHFHKGRYWTYNSAVAFQKLFPYMHKQAIARHLRKLEDLGVLVSDNFNKLAYDKTKWYAIEDNPCSKMNKDSLEMNKDSSKINNPELNIEQPIPDNKPNITSYNKLVETNFKKWTLKDFENEIKQHQGAAEISREELINFYHYWIEPDPKGRMRFQLEKTWSTPLRIQNWAKRAKTYNKKYETKEQHAQTKMFEAGIDLINDYLSQE